MVQSERAACSRATSACVINTFSHEEAELEVEDARLRDHDIVKEKSKELSLRHVTFTRTH